MSPGWHTFLHIDLFVRSISVKAFHLINCPSKDSEVTDVDLEHHEKVLYEWSGCRYLPLPGTFPAISSIVGTYESRQRSLNRVQRM